MSTWGRRRPVSCRRAVGQVAPRLRMHGVAARRAPADGLSLWQADLAAIRAAPHLTTVWPEWHGRDLADPVAFAGGRRLRWWR